MITIKTTVPSWKEVTFKEVCDACRLTDVNLGVFYVRDVFNQNECFSFIQIEISDCDESCIDEAKVFHRLKNIKDPIEVMNILSKGSYEYLSCAIPDRYVEVTKEEYNSAMVKSAMEYR